MPDIEKLIVDSIALDQSRLWFPLRKSIHILTLKLKPDDVVTIDGKKVAKIRLHFTIGDSKDTKNQLDYSPHGSGVWQITFADKSKISRILLTNKVQDCVDGFMEAGATLGRFVQEMGGGPDWHDKSMLKIYEENKAYTPQENYNKLHTLLSQMILVILETLKKKQLSDVNIIDGGCGSGLFLKALESQLPKNISTNLYGFDFNEANIAECKDGYSGKIDFFQGNLLHIGEILKKLKNAPTILVLSGSLTRLVLHNGFEALQILQQAAVANVDYIIGGGQGLPLLNHFIAKRVGYKLLMDNIGDPTQGNSFGCKKLPAEKILENKILKIKTRNILDLSLSPDPLALLKELNTQGVIKNGIQIDFSYARLTEESIAGLAEILQPYKDTKIIIWHWDTLLLKIFKKYFPQADARKSLNDLYLTAPRAHLKTLSRSVALLDTPTQDIEFVDRNELNFYVDSNNVNALNEILNKPDNLGQIITIRDRAVYRKDWVLVAKIVKQNPELGQFYIRDFAKMREGLKALTEILAKEKAFYAIYQVLVNIIREEIDDFFAILKENNIDLSLVRNKEGETLLNILLPPYTSFFEIKKGESSLAILIAAETGSTMLHQAVSNRENNDVILQLLEAKKVDLSKLNFKGMNLLHCAAQKNNSQIARYLIDHHPELLQQEDVFGRSPVHYWVSSGCSIDELHLLRDKSGDLSKKDKAGNTVLHLFMKNFLDKRLTTDILDFYFKYFPEIFNVMNDQNQTPINIAVSQKIQPLLVWLINKNLMPAQSKYKLFKPADLSLGGLEVIPQGNFGDINEITVKSFEDRITIIELSYTSNEPLPVELEEYLQHEVAGLNIFLDPNKKTITIEAVYSIPFSSNKGMAYHYSFKSDSFTSKPINEQKLLPYKILPEQIQAAFTVLEKVGAITADVKQKLFTFVTEELPQKINSLKPKM